MISSSWAGPSSPASSISSMSPCTRQMGTSKELQCRSEPLRASSSWSSFSAMGWLPVSGWARAMIPAAEAAPAGAAMAAGAARAMGAGAGSTGTARGAGAAGAGAGQVEVPARPRGVAWIRAPRGVRLRGQAEGLVARSVVEGGLAPGGPGFRQVGGDDLLGQHVDHGAGQRVGQEGQPPAVGQLEHRRLVGLQVQPDAPPGRDVGQQLVDLRHARLLSRNNSSW